LQSESAQHCSAQPVLQQTLPCSQNSLRQKPFAHESVVHGLESPHAAEFGSASLQAISGRQLSVTEQNSSGPQAASFGTNMHLPAKQVLVVQPTASSQSASSQHPAQSPLQHFSGALHLGADAQEPCVVQKSFVQLSLSLQSSGPLQVLAPPPTALPAVLVAPALLLPPVVGLPPFELAPASPPPSNWAPLQALTNSGTNVATASSTPSLRAAAFTKLRPE
jgi:hypothetical protein